MKGNALSLFALGFVLGALNFAGLLACCVGMIFTAPFGILALCVAYLHMSGQCTAADGPMPMAGPPGYPPTAYPPAAYPPPPGSSM